MVDSHPPSAPQTPRRPPVTRKIIGISGPDGVGKSTLAHALGDHLSRRSVGLIRVARVAFADQLREELLEMLALANNNRTLSNCQPHIDVWQKPTSAPVRNMLRGYGDWRRQYAPDYWVRAWEFRLECVTRDTRGGPLLVVCDDVRYQNEAHAIQDLGGSIIYLDDTYRPAHELIGREGSHQLLDVRLAADLVISVCPGRDIWASPEAIVEQLCIVED